jgi:hypothetical protein
LPAVIGFFSRSIEMNGFELLLLSNENRCELAVIIAGLLLATPITFTLCDTKLSVRSRNYSSKIVQLSYRWDVLNGVL